MLNKDFKKMAKNAKNDLKIHVSPEGAEEKIIDDFSIVITQTANGRFRVYVDGNPAYICDTEQEAKDHRTHLMALFASMHIDPQGTIEKMIGSMRSIK